MELNGGSSSFKYRTLIAFLPYAHEPKWHANIDGTNTVTDTIIGKQIFLIQNILSPKQGKNNSRRQDKTEDNMLQSTMQRETPVICVYLAWNCWNNEVSHFESCPLAPSDSPSSCGLV